MVGQVSEKPAVRTMIETMTGHGQMSDQDLLHVQALEVDYGGTSIALRGATLSVPGGAAVALLGTNGAGKTTMIRAVTGLLRHHGGRVVRGEVRYAGADITRTRPHRIVSSGVAQVPEGRMVFKHLTVEENLLVGAATRTRRQAAETLKQMYELFPPLARRREGRAGWMSGGEQQMVAVARALMARPRLLVLDEVSLGLAPKVVEEIFERLGEARQELGLTILLVEQNARLALSFVDYGYVLANGVITLQGPAENLRDNALIQASFLGSGKLAVHQRFGERTPTEAGGVS
jgi:branched-chain amino acid transport system ATP-binding protein